jgi:hypothetical protein
MEEQPVPPVGNEAPGPASPPPGDPALVPGAWPAPPPGAWPPAPPPTSGWPGAWPPPPANAWPNRWPPPPAGPPFVPGLAFYAATVAVLLVGLIASALSDLGGAVFLAEMIGLLIGLVWLGGFWAAVVETHLRLSRRTWARWVAIPLMCFTTLALVNSGVPMYADIQLSKPALEQAAARAEAGQPHGAGWIGFVWVHDVRVSGGATLFLVTQGDWSVGCGLAYEAGTGTAALETWLANSYQDTDYGDGLWGWCSYGSSD